ncbi:accessory gene regulator ArgB-like protein [Clostridium sp. Marseille-P2415]|uniref:accessory gene regulator ArgB-like protein n=1 Tax=Clostridium sp. Marseille-P2415 TaxID=1805471 RepID=UPI0009887EC4|nr:accessory gene regulator B family protein [Clostridium sp. Marseille-P2415]
MIRMISWKEHMIEKLVLYNIIPEEETEIYTFGMECLVLKLIHCISYFGIAACLGMLPELIVIGCVLIPLRRSAGGYHAKTRTGCYLFSCFYVFIILFVSKAVINQYMWWGALALSDGVIFFMSPVDNDNKKLDEKETLYYRKKSRHILILVNIGCVLLTVFHFYKTGSLLGYGIYAAAFLLLLQKITAKINKATVNYC